MGSSKHILYTLLYSDIFDYPLTREELWHYLLFLPQGNKNPIPQNLDFLLKKLNKYIQYNNGFFYLSGRDSIVQSRKRREKISKEKLIVAQKIAKILSFIPSVLFIGISGSLSMGNAKKDDDIDFFVICKRKSIWTTRLIMVFLLDILGVRRTRGKRRYTNKICLNMLVTEEKLKISIEKQNVYSAHEVVQLQPLFERENTHIKFLQANKWVVKYLPNALFNNNQEKAIKSMLNEFIYLLICNSVFEFFSKRVQLWYMKKHKTTETISDNLLAFHPYNHESWIVAEFYKRIKKYEKI